MCYYWEVIFIRGNRLYKVEPTAIVGDTIVQFCQACPHIAAEVDTQRVPMVLCWVILCLFATAGFALFCRGPSIIQYADDSDADSEF